MKQSEEWASSWTMRIAGAINEQRQKLGLSAQDISDRCSAFGYPITRPVVSRIYSGQKKSISVPEVVVLAEALEIPPVQLLFPLTSADERIDYLPGIDEELFISLRRFTGEGWGNDTRIPAAIGLEGDQAGDTNLRLIRHVVRLELSALEILGRELEGWESDEEKQQDEERLALTLRRAIGWRKTLERAGITPRTPTRLKSAYARESAKIRAQNGGDQ